MERCPSWPKEHDWKSCRRQKRLEGSNPSLSAIIVWPVGQGVKTPPFHGGNMGSNPIRVTFFNSIRDENPKEKILAFLVVYLLRY